MTSVSFGAPEWFWGLLTVPVLAVIFVRAERRGAERLREFVGPRLLPNLIGTVDRTRRAFRFALQLFGLSCAVIALAQPRWGYTYQDVKRKGLDLLIAVDTSRSMLSNDVQPNRLERVKLATQDLINQLTGDRVGLIAFAGRAFIQAPLTIDYDAVTESITDLDTKTIPEGGTNISEAIVLATRTFGKSAAGNRALIIFTDGEELSGDAVKAAKIAADDGVRIFTIGVGTPQGSLIPLPDENGGTSFVKDSGGKVVKSKLDQKRLEEIAKTTGGVYLHLESGPRTAKQLLTEGLAKMKAAEMDVRLSRRPIERYQWPLGVALLALTLSVLIGERKRARFKIPQIARFVAPATASVVLMLCRTAIGAVPGLELYDSGKFPDAYRSFEQDLQSHPNSDARDRIQFDAGTAAYRMRDYNKALESFSGALLSGDTDLQERSHYNIGRTLEERADMEKSEDDSLKDLEDSQSHYEEALKLNPNDKAAKANLEEVRKKIERLKKKPKPTPTPPPQPPPQQKKDNQNSDQKNQQNQSSSQNQQRQQEQQSQSQDQNKTAQNQKSQQQKSQSQNQQSQNQQQSQSLAKNEPQKNQQPQPNESPSPSQGNERNEDRQSPDQNKSDQQNTPPAGQNQTPSPSPGEGSEENQEPSSTPSATPNRKQGGELKAAPGEESQQPPENAAQLATAQPPKEGQMTPEEAQALLQSMKDEEARVRLDERRPRRNVYNDW